MTHRGQRLPHPRMSAFALTREERRLRRVSKDEVSRGLMVRDGASTPPPHEERTPPPPPLPEIDGGGAFDDCDAGHGAGATGNAGAPEADHCGRILGPPPVLV